MPALPDIGSSLPEVVLRTAIVYETEEVRAAIRSHGLAGVEDVRLAVLETDGSISVVPRDEGASRSNRPPSDERTI